MVKDALLKCKRRPFATQKMPFYKAFYNLLNISMLQSDNRELICNLVQCREQIAQLELGEHNQKGTEE